MLKILKEDLHLIVVIIAAVAAVFLETLGLMPEKYVPPLILLLLALLAFFQVTHGPRLEEKQESIAKRLTEIETKVRDPEILLIKPPNLFARTNQLAHLNKGEVWFFNMCSHMFISDDVRDQFIRPFLQNKHTKSLTFINKVEEQELWESEVAPKMASYKSAEKINKPIFRDIEEHIAFVMTELRTDKESREALLAIWGEPFMAAYPGTVLNQTHPQKPQSYIPRYYIVIKSYSDLIPRLKDIWDKYSFKH